MTHSIRTIRFARCALTCAALATAAFAPAAWAQNGGAGGGDGGGAAQTQSAQPGTRSGNAKMPRTTHHRWHKRHSKTNDMGATHSMGTSSNGTAGYMEPNGSRGRSSGSTGSGGGAAGGPGSGGSNGSSGY